MRKILSKLNVDTREEAADYWRGDNVLRPRFARLFRDRNADAGPANWLFAGWRAVGVVGAGALVAALAACGDDEPAPGGVDTTSTPGTPTASATLTASPTVVVTPGTPTPRVITLDTSPQPQPPEVTRALGPAPESVFPAWDGGSTVIYDVETGSAIDLGPGAQPAYFSPDETMAVFAAGNAFGEGTEVFLVALPSGATRSLGPGRVAVFIDNESVMAFLPDRSNERVRIAIATGAREPFTGDSNVLFSNPQLRTVPPGYEADPSGPTSPDVRTFTVTTSSGDLVLTVDAVAMTAAGRNEVAVVAPPVDGQSNVYIIDLVTGEATYIATAIPGKDNFPFSANEDYVVWTDGYCTLESGPVTLFDRGTGELIRLS